MEYVNGNYAGLVAKLNTSPLQPRAITLKSGTITVTGNQADSVFAGNSLRGAKMAVLVRVEVTAIGGTGTPTFTFSIQDSATAGGSYASEASGADLTANGTYFFAAILANPYYRASWVVSGTNPTAKIDVTVTPFEFGDSI